MPLAAVPPLAHVHCFVAHSRFRVVVGAMVSYWEPLHVVQSKQDAPLR